MDRESRYKKLGFKPQKEIIYNKLLPYADKLDEESQRMLFEIKSNLGLSVMMREMRPGCGMWTARLKKYIKLYGLKFSKEDHLHFVHLMYELVIIPNLEPYLVSKFAHVLITLLKKKELISPAELVLPWRPLYDVCKRIFSSSRAAIGMYRYFSSLEVTLDSLVHAARFYFPASATEEMLNEWRPLLCPFDNNTMGSTVETMEWFLPIALPPALSDMGYKLWFKDMMELWQVCNNSPNWECDMMWLMARLARCNIGYIDWEPYIPLIFTRFLRSLNLPVSYKHIQNSKSHKLDTTAMALWIVSVLGGGSSAQKFLDKFMMALESYFHPANFGRWVMKLAELLSKLPLYFVQRLHFERYKKITWQTPVPDSHKLTEDDITKFVLSVRQVAMQAMYSKMGLEVSSAMQHLATLRPQLIIPEIVESVYANLETVVQPHKFQAALQCLIAVIRPMAEGTDFKEGPTHVIPLLLSVLPGIDPNDIRKCFVSLHFISTVANMVPIVDCSKASEYYTNLTEEEETICLATSSFGDFVLQFLDRCFVLVESSSLESTRLEREADRRSRMENLAENALASTCITVLTQTSSQIFKAALRKLHSFVMGRILETKVAGQFMAAMCRSFSKVNGEETLRVFLPCLCENILTLTDSEEILKEETLDNELLYNLVLISEIVDCPGKFLLPHVPLLMKVLDRTLHLSCREGYTTAARLLQLILNSLCSTVPLEFRSMHHTFDEPINDFLPIRSWAKAGNIHDLQVKWYVPGKEEINCVKLFVDTYLCPEMQSIEQFIHDAASMTRDELQRSLGIIWAFLGCRVLLPQHDDSPLELVKSCLKESPFCSSADTEVEKNKRKLGITVNDQNIRLVLVTLMDRLQTKLLLCKEDDTKSFFVLMNIWECLLTNIHEEKIAFESRWKRFRLVKRILENKLVGDKRHLRALLIDRAFLQHEILLERGNFCLTPTHKVVMLNLLTLSTSQYSEVRARAQSKLFSAMEMFPYSYVILVPRLVECLKKDTLLEHEQFKGALHVLLGPKQNPVVARHDWYILNSLWPAIVRAKPSEKISVIRLLETIVEVVHKQFPTITINLEIPDTCEAAGRNLWRSAQGETNEITFKNTVREGKQHLELKNQYNLEQYLSLLHSLNNAIDNENLHWRFHSMALSFLRDLVHPDVAYPPAVVKCFLNTLVNDSLELRKIAMRGVIFLLKQQKRVQKVIKINPHLVDGAGDISYRICPGNRSDNQWVQFRLTEVPRSAEDWNKQRYAHRPYHGFYAWPTELKLYEQSLDPPPLMMESLNDKEKEVKHFFSNLENVDKLVNFFTLEEKKGKDKFNGYKFLLFKGIFRNGGYDVFKIFMPHLEKLVNSKQESHQRCAAEIISGAVRGAKHWPYEMVQNMWNCLTPVIRCVLSNMTEETVIDWGVCFATAAENIDPRRNYWLYEVLMEEPVRNETSFIECGRLYALQGALNQQLWRMAEKHTLWLERLRPYLSHPFQNVRERMGSVLNNIFEGDITFSNGNPPKSPHISEFIDSVVPQLALLYNICPEAVDRHECINKECDTQAKIDSVVREAIAGDIQVQPMVVDIATSDGKPEDFAIRLLKTVSKWISARVARSQFGVSPHFYQLLPLICLMESYESDEELSRSCTCVLLALGQTIHIPQNVSAALTAIKKVSQSSSWQARATCLEFLQVFVFNNMPVILSSQKWTSEVNNIVLRLMEDDWLDVRVKSAQVLGGLLHTGFIEDSRTLLGVFKDKASKKVNKTNERVDANSLKLRHAGVLGLCAFINAYPYDVPEFIPDLFVILGQHLNDPQPIPSTIRKTLGDFKRTHHDNWAQHSLKFSEAQLTVLGDLTIPPSYYA